MFLIMHNLSKPFPINYLKIQAHKLKYAIPNSYKSELQKMCFLEPQKMCHLRLS